VQVDAFALPQALQINAEIEFERNRERYEFLRWGADAFENFSVVPPERGICHQVNLEYLAQGVLTPRPTRASRSPTPTRSSAPTATRR
jgi:aconitate hydratase